mmetsp:Transcript_3702/g.14082  ORF Transcript_3702/g.14082 Transcript_3702/m.14082 type:complete len:127 (-) Transcript_3702:3908-4288(-)
MSEPINLRCAALRNSVPVKGACCQIVNKFTLRTFIVFIHWVDSSSQECFVEELQGNEMVVSLQPLSCAAWYPQQDVDFLLKMSQLNSRQPVAQCHWHHTQLHSQTPLSAEAGAQNARCLHHTNEPA